MVEGELHLLNGLVPSIREALEVHDLRRIARQHDAGRIVQHAAVGFGVDLARAVVGELAHVQLRIDLVLGQGHEREVGDALGEVAAGRLVHPDHAGVALRVGQQLAVHLRHDEGIVLKQPIDAHLRVIVAVAADGTHHVGARLGLGVVDDGLQRNALDLALHDGGLAYAVDGAIHFHNLLHGAELLLHLGKRHLDRVLAIAVDRDDPVLVDGLILLGIVGQPLAGLVFHGLEDAVFSRRDRGLIVGDRRLQLVGFHVGDALVQVVLDLVPAIEHAGVGVDVVARLAVAVVVVQEHRAVHMQRVNGIGQLMPRIRVGVARDAVLIALLGGIPEEDQAMVRRQAHQRVLQRVARCAPAFVGIEVRIVPHRQGPVARGCRCGRYSDAAPSPSRWPRSSRCSCRSRGARPRCR